MLRGIFAQKRLQQIRQVESFGQLDRRLQMRVNIDQSRHQVLSLRIEAWPVAVLCGWPDFGDAAVLYI